jgi:hypothetical protein
MVASSPDVIFYTIPTKIDQVVDISLADSTQNIYEIYDEIRAALPDALIVLVTPPPAEAKVADWNSRALDYRNYTNNLLEENAAFAVPLYDLHADFFTELTNRSETLTNFMDAAGLELNEAGQQLYGEMFANSLRTKMINTTAGLYVEGEKPAHTPIAPTLVVPEVPVPVIEEAVSEETVYEEPVYVEPTYVAPTYEYVVPVTDTPVTTVEDTTTDAATNATVPAE